MTREQKALAIYDLLRQAHKSINQIWNDYPDLIRTDIEQLKHWEVAIDAVDNTLYLAEEFFVSESK